MLGDASAALARVGGEAGDDARAQVAAWQALARGERARAIAAAVAAVRAPVPAGAERVDRSWSEAALAGDDDRARAAWEARRADPVGVWWCRRVSASWVALPAEDAAAGVDDLARWPAAAIVAAMRRLTLAMVAHVTLEAGAAAIARLATTLVDGGALVELARRLRAAPEVRVALGPARVAAEWVRAVDVRTDVGLGATMLARHLRGDARRQVELLVPVGTLVDGDGPAVGWPAIRSLVDEHR